MAYFIQFDPTGLPIAKGVYDNPTEALPSNVTNEYWCTKDQWDAYQNMVLVNGQIEPASAVQLLQPARDAKLADLQAHCDGVISGGFASSALGLGTYTYPSNDTDQQNLSDAMSASLAPNQASDWTALLWCATPTGEWAMVAHTAVQVQAVHADWMAFRQGAQMQLITKTAAANTAQSVQAVNAVVWQ